VTLTVDDGAEQDACLTTVALGDSAAPQISCPQDTAIECDGSGNLAALDAWLNAATAEDVCGSAAITDLITEPSTSCVGTGLILATWTATDACDLSETCSAGFTIADTTPPSLTLNTTPIDVVDVDCSGDEPALLPEANASDTCTAVRITDDAPATFPAGETTPVTFTATDACDLSAQQTLDVRVRHGANIAVTAARHTVGTGSNPGSVKEPLVGIVVCAYVASPSSCARLTCGGVSHRQYECIAVGGRTPGTPCEAASCCTTDGSGQCLLDVPPGDYVVISADATKTVLPDPLGVSAGGLLCGQTQQKYLQQIIKADGQKVPGKTTRLTGSELLIIEPEYVVWDDPEQLYPFVLETVGEWDVTVSVAPPDGFIADHEQLWTLVTDELDAVQFTITEVGSDLVPTQTTFDVVHNGQSHRVRSNVGLYLTSAYARSRGFDVALLHRQGLIKDPPRPPKNSHKPGQDR